MTERDVFLTALGKQDPAARAAVCAGKPALRQRLEHFLTCGRHQAPRLFPTAGVVPVVLLSL
jgi:hypothetical protein